MDIFSGEFNNNLKNPIYYDKIGGGPNLISNNTINEIQGLINNKNIKTEEIKINDGVSNFYENYIQPNIFFIILAVLFLLFLYWKYETKNSEEIWKNIQI